MKGVTEMKIVLPLPQSSDPAKDTAPVHRLCDRVPCGISYGKPTDKAQRMEPFILPKKKKGNKGFPEEVASEPGLRG